jgi:hypothetical protein
MNLGRCKVTLGLSAWKTGISVFVSHDAPSYRAPNVARRARGRGISKYPFLPHPLSFLTLFPSPPSTHPPKRPFLPYASSAHLQICIERGKHITGRA